MIQYCIVTHKKKQSLPSHIVSQLEGVHRLFDSFDVTCVRAAASPDEACTKLDPLFHIVLQRYAILFALPTTIEKIIMKLTTPNSHE